MNVHDSERMAGLLEQAGYEPTADDQDADVVLINTCSVRERAEEKLFTRLGEFHQMELETGQRPIVAVAGCVAQQEGAQILRRSKAVDVIIGTQNLKRLPVLVNQAVETPRRRAPAIDLDPLGDVSFPLGIAQPKRSREGVRHHHRRLQRILRVLRGPVHARPRTNASGSRHRRGGPPRRRAPAPGKFSSSGRSSITIRRQTMPPAISPDCSSGCQDIDGLDRIRFASPHPRHVTPRMIDAMRSLPKVCRHLHLPVQSGSTRILAAMRRRHTREDYLS